MNVHWMLAKQWNIDGHKSLLHGKTGHVDLGTIQRGTETAGWKDFIWKLQVNVDRSEEPHSLSSKSPYMWTFQKQIRSGLSYVRIKCQCALGHVHHVHLIERTDCFATRAHDILAL